MTTVDVQVVRSYRKHAVRSYRLLFNSLNAALTELTATLVSGKSLATSVSNDVLRSFSVGDWVKALGLDAQSQSVLSRRLDSRIQENKEELVKSLETLRRIVRDMAAALEAFREGMWADIACDDDAHEVLRDVSMREEQVSQRSTTTSLMSTTTSLTHRQVCCTVDGVVGMCWREVEEVKRLVVEDIVRACEGYRKVKGTGGEGGVYATREYWELRVLAWVTDVYLERDKVERNMKTMAVDAGLPYYVK